MFLENEDHDGATEDNNEKIDCIRQLILLIFKSHLNANRVRTWDDILYSYSTENQNVENQIAELKADLIEKINKIDFDIADIKYLLLDNIPSQLVLRNFFIQNYMEFFSNFECSITKEAYFLQINSYQSEFITVSQGLISDIIETVSSPISPSMDRMKFWEYFYANFKERLINLQASRIELIHQKNGSISELKMQLEARREKLNRLESALENPLQRQVQ